MAEIISGLEGIVVYGVSGNIILAGKLEIVLLIANQDKKNRVYIFVISFVVFVFRWKKF